MEEPVSRFPSCPEAADTKVTGVEENSCARVMAMVTACCFVRPSAEPPHAQTSPDAAITSVARKPIRRNR